MTLEEKIAAIIGKFVIVPGRDEYDPCPCLDKNDCEKLAKEIMKIIEEHCEERDGDSIHCSWCGAWKRLVPKEEMMFRGTKE
jgi:hypothetical protein